MQVDITPSVPHPRHRYPALSAGLHPLDPPSRIPAPTSEFHDGFSPLQGCNPQERERYTISYTTSPHLVRALPSDLERVSPYLGSVLVATDHPLASELDVGLDL